MDDHELARHLDAVLAAQSLTRWAAAAVVLAVWGVLVVRARRLVRSAAAGRPARGRAAVAVATVAAVALVTTLAWTQHEVRRTGAAATADVVAWVERTEHLRVTGAFRGCVNDVPPPHARTCLSAHAVDDRGAEHRVGFRWYRLPGDAVDVQVEVDRAAPAG